MLKEIAFKVDHRCFKKDEKFIFKKGINLLVGDQGCGKSTLISMLRQDTKANREIISYVIDKDSSQMRILSFDCEKDNPRIKPSFESEFQISAMFWSHGEAIQSILRSLTLAKNAFIVIDEPDTGMSIRSCIEIVSIFNEAVNNGCQIFASAHSPVLIESVPEVLSLEHKKWMSCGEFIQSHQSLK